MMNIFIFNDSYSEFPYHVNYDVQHFNLHFFSFLMLRKGHYNLQNDIETVVTGLNATLEGVSIANININFNSQKNIVNMVADSDSENESIEDINLKEV